MSKFRLSVVTPSKPTIKHKSGAGWGDDAVITIVEGFPMEIVIHKDRTPQFGFRILEDGTIILTDYGRMCYQTYVQNLRLTPDRPWKEKRDEGC